MWAGINPSDPIYCSDKNEPLQKIDNSVLGLQPFVVPPVLLEKTVFMITLF
jgi:hypothetical protein